MKLLVAGREGQVARALARLQGADVIALGRPALDITDRDTIARAIDAHRPDIVVNAAAYTAVDRAESERDLAFAVNDRGAANVAAAAAAAGLPVIHLSTDYVFAGDKPAPYVESDATGPLNVYGVSKLAGERAVATANPAHAILRTSWVFGADGANFLRTMLRLGSERDVVRVVADQRGAPTHADDIAAAILPVARAMRGGPEDARGVFHFTASGETTWAGFAKEIFRRSAELGGAAAKVEPIATADYPTPARRPANSRLDLRRFRRVFGHQPPDWRDGVARAVATLLQPKTR